MIKRSEIKSIWHNDNILDARNFIISSQALNIYPSRKIHSTYFENINRQMYLDSIEGLVPRKKIRIRSYENLLDSSPHFEEKFEIKYTYEDFREKKVEPLSIQTFQNTYHDNIYGLCSKILKINFIREYYLIGESRITIDYEIKATNVNNSKISLPINKIIIEFKSFNFEANAELIDNLGLRRNRFSKYTEGINILNIHNEYPIT
tara:strand:+ start:733 stop:1347 length:615 start_codon:yes stop_codon:yes gene_type:complete